MIIIVITGFVGFGIPIQALLILASAYAAWIAKRVGLKWSDLEEGITNRLATAMPQFYYFSSGYYCWHMDVLWHSTCFDLLWFRVFKS